MLQLIHFGEIILFDVLFIALILEHFKECAKFGAVGKPEPSGILQRKKLGKKKN